MSAAFSVGAIIPLSVAIATTEGDSFGGGKFLAKLGLGLILGGIAAFLGRESGHHRKREQDYRKNALDLAAIGPYIELLDPATQKMIRLALAPRLFGPYSEAVANEQVSDALVREGLIRLMKDASPGSPGAPPMPPGAAP